MTDDSEYEGIVRKEVAERVDGILRALRDAQPEPWDAVYRHAHSLVGIAGDVDPRMADAAKQLAGALRDDYGRPMRVTPERETEIRACVDRLAAARQALD